MGNEQTSAQLRRNQQLYEVASQSTQDSQHQNNETDQEIQVTIEDLQAILQLYSQIRRMEIDEEIEKQQNTQINIKEDFKIHVGIDFGTNGCGLCYAIKNELWPQKEKSDDDSDSDSDSTDKDDNDNDTTGNADEDKYRIINHQWDDLAYDNSKLNTCILLDDNNEFQMFGNTARIQFTEMQKKDWKLFDNFKMSLYDGENNESIDDEEKKDDGNGKRGLKREISSCNGVLTASDIVFTEALKHLKQAAMDYINVKLEIADITVDDIQWILTIPSIWNHGAKYMMRKWGKESGLINPDITNHLKIVLEPECASLQIQYEFRNDNKIKFNKDEKYILVDAGGGTVDIVAHTIYSNFGVKEIIPSTGGPYGSVNIDKKMEQLFDEIFGKTNMDNFKKNYTKTYIKMFEELIQSKCDFYSNVKIDEDEDSKQQYARDEYHSITLSKKFYIEMKNTDSRLKKNIKKIDKILGVTANEINVDVKNKEYLLKINDKSSIDFVYLEIHKNVWMRIFDECCINPIIGIVSKIIQTNDILKDIKYIFMVGGLSKSKYFQQRMKNEFKNICIVIPKNPLLSVVSGAARYGLQTDFVHTRILKQTYAVRVSESLSSLLAENEGRKICEYIKDNDTENKNDEMEEKLNKILNKDGLFTEDERKNNNDEQLRQLLCSKIEPDLAVREISDDWIKDNVSFNRFAGDNEDKFICSSLLSVLASKGQEIVINGEEKITKRYLRHSKDQKMSNIEIYCSDVVDPRRIDETVKTKKLCEGKLKYPDDAVLEVIFELSFDDSLLIAYAYPMGKREERAEVAIEYQTN